MSGRRPAETPGAGRFSSAFLPIPEDVYQTCPDLYLASLALLYGVVARIPHPASLWRDHGANRSYHEPFEERLRQHVYREARCLETLAAHCLDAGIAPDPDEWRRHSWWGRILATVEDIVRIVPPGETFIMVDEAMWSTGAIVANRRRLPFLEHNGYYWGLPENDQHAIQELERLSRGGAAFIFFPWITFWWLETYRGLRGYLDGQFRRVIDTNRLAGFDIRPRAAAPGQPSDLN